MDDLEHHGLLGNGHDQSWHMGDGFIYSECWIELARGNSLHVSCGRSFVCLKRKSHDQCQVKMLIKGSGSLARHVLPFQWYSTAL